MTGIVSFLYNQTLTSINTATPDLEGDRTLTAKYEDVKCRFQLKTGSITHKSGKELQYRGVIFLAPSYSVVEGDRIIYSGETYVVVGIETRYNFQGVADHTQLYVA